MAVSFSTDAIRQRVINRLRSKNSWNNILDTAASQQIIDVFAEEFYYFANFDSYLTRETKWELARNKTSLIANSSLNYNPHRKKSSTGYVTISADKTFNLEPSYNITIPKYTQFSTNAGLKFVTTTTDTLTTSDKEKDFEIIQGIQRTYSTFAVGDEFEEFEITSDNIENGFYELYVNNVLWQPINNIFEASYSDKVYQISNKIDFSGIYIKFGNNINGKKLISNDSIVFKYIQTDGLSGNINSSNYITVVDSTVFDVNNIATKIYCKNKNAVLGGVDVESIEEIRLNAPKFYQAGMRSSTNEDYIQIIRANFDYIYNIIVWGAYENNIDNGRNSWDLINLNDNNVFVSVIKQDYTGTLTTQEKQDISAELNLYKSPTDIVVFQDAVIVNLIFKSYIYISDRSYTLNTVKDSVNTSLIENYSIQNRDFFTPIRVSDYIKVIDNTAGVDYHHTTTALFEYYYFNASFSFTINLSVYPLKTSSLKVYAKDIVNNTDEFLLGYDDGTGNIIGNSTTDETGAPLIYDLGTNSDINYTLGIGALEWLNPTEAYTNYQIRIEYESLNDDLILKKRYHIFNYSETYSLNNLIPNYV